MLGFAGKSVFNHTLRMPAYTPDKHADTKGTG